jgi:hypothetical protein
MSYITECNFRIGTFYDLEAKYLTTKPIKGKVADDIRPLEKRSKQHMRVVKIDDDTYACRLYYTDVAVYHRNGLVKITLNGWNTMSTRNFLYHVLPYGFRINYHNQRVHVANSSAVEGWHGMGEALTLNSHTGEILGGIQPTKQAVNREESKAKRAKYKPFLAWAKSYMVTLGLEVPREHTNISLHEFMNEPENFPEDKYLDVLATFVNQRWYQQKSYEDVKKQLFKEGTVYDTINLPTGSLHGK